MKYYILLFCGLFFFSCKTTKDISQLTEEDVKVYIKRGACFGKCPIYSMKVYDGGYTVLDANKFGKRQGKYSKTLKKKEYKALVKAFNNANVYQFDDEYPSDIPDLPSILITYKGESGKKSIIGKDNRPAEVMELQYMLEKIYDEDNWTLIEAAPVMTEKKETIEVQKEEFDKSKIIIKPKQGTRLPTFFKEMDKYGVQLVTRISEDQNLWLITYDRSQMDPEEMLDMIKNHKGIEMAQFDKKVTARDR
jgi:hypothetical protein